MSERVAIVGIGETAGKRRRPEISEVELVNEAVRAALEDAQLTIKDIDAVVLGNMEFFEGTFFTDQWLVEGLGFLPEIGDEGKCRRGHRRRRIHHGGRPRGIGDV